ncbi:unnamed protein product [Sympodiomycopsis kandeliae]
MTDQWELITLHCDRPESSASSFLQGDLSPALHTVTAKHYLSQVARVFGKRSTSVTSSSSSNVLDFPTKLQAPDTPGPEAIELIAASLQAFIQLNWTGPELPSDLQLLDLLRWADVDAFQPRSMDAEQSEREELQLQNSINSAANEALTLDGEPAYHLCQAPWFLALAIGVLNSLRSGQGSEKLETLPWWSLRVFSIHNRVLDSPVSVRKEVLQDVDSLLGDLQQRSQSQSQMASHPDQTQPQWSLLHARLLLEKGLALSRMGQDREANELYLQAAQATGLRYELTGALGKKTKFQKEEKTILVVLAESSPEACKEMPEADSNDKVEESASAADADTEEQEEAGDEVSALPDKSGWKSAPIDGQRSGMPSDYALNDDTLLERTKFTSTASAETITHRDPANQPALAPLDQSILLALSLFIRNSAPEHGLTTSQISAFVSRVAMHPRNWSVFTMALLLRCRLEATRTRTVQRSVLQLQALLDQMPTTDSSSQERLKYFYQLDLPPKWELQAELAKRYAMLGVLRSALEIFQTIELWEEVVQCLGMLGRSEEGVEVVRDLLQGKKIEAEAALANRKHQTTFSQRYSNARQAKLWCLLGDLEPANAEAHYKQAWEVSNHSSARAARSLGGMYFALARTDEDFATVITWLRRAVRISSLMARTWFMLGCAYMRREEYGKAARSFRRCTAIDEEDGESWNNLASCYLRMVNGFTVEDIEADDSDMEGYDSDSESDGSRTVQSDSGVEMSSSSEAEDDEHSNDDVTSTRKEKLSPFVLKTLAHRCLKHALKYNPDSWKVWSNYCIVSIDIGEMGEACRALVKVIRHKSRSGEGRLKEEDIDWQVVDRLVDAVIRAPGQTIEEQQEEQQADETSKPAPEMTYEQATAGAVSVPVANGQSSSTKGPRRSPNEGRGLYPAVTSLLCDTLLPTLTHPRLHRAHARLLLWSKDYAGALEAHQAAYRCSIAGDAAYIDQVSSNQAKWSEAVEEVKETIDSIDTLGTRMDQEKETKFKARSILRTFMARFKVWEDTQEWEELLALREELK